MELIPLKTRVVKSGHRLIDILGEALMKNRIRLKEKDILVIASKIVSVAEGRVVNLSKVNVSPRAKRMKKTRYGRGREDPRMVQLVLDEADAIFPGAMLLTLKNKALIPEAGIDLSNAPHGHAILWPKDPEKSARKIWMELRKKYQLKKFGVLLIDSRCQPLRWGTVGLALAGAGFEFLDDARGKKDIYGKPLRFTQKAIADNLASAAEILMGEASEKIPFVLIRGAPIPFTKRKISSRTIWVTPKDDLFSGIYSKKFLSDFVKTKRGGIV